MVYSSCFYSVQLFYLGANSGYAIYLAHYLENNTFAGGSKLDYASIGGLAFSCGLFLPQL